MELLGPDELEFSPTVANCRMNRERQLQGSNSYSRDLRFDIAAWLTERARTGSVRWVDLCCGSARALIEAADLLSITGLELQVSITGIDLAGLFVRPSASHLLTLRVQSAEAWTPRESLSLITCVHGLHYVGDKLALIAKAVRHLEPNGLFLANLDLSNLRLGNGKPAGRHVTTALRQAGLEYETRQRLLRCLGPRNLEFPLTYLGADDQAGPNSTGQPAVDSYYSAIAPARV